MAKRCRATLGLALVLDLVIVMQLALWGDPSSLRAQEKNGAESAESRPSTQGEREKPSASSFPKGSKEAQDKRFVEYSDRLILKPFIQSSSFEFTISSAAEEAGAKELRFKPNIYASYGMGFSYWLFGFSLSSQFNDIDKNPTRYGRSSSFDFQFNYYGDFYGFDFNLTDYKGFYVDNSGDFSEGDAAAPKKLIYSQLHAASLGVNAYYMFTPERISLSAAFDQSGRQLESGGSWLLMLSYNQMVVDNPEAVIPASQQAYYGDLGDFYGGYFLTLSLAPGFAYSLVWRNWYLTPVLFAGLGLQAQGFETQTRQQALESTGTALKLNWRISAGYNGDRFFAGFYIVNDMGHVFHEASEFSLMSQTISLRILMGYRFFG